MLWDDLFECPSGAQLNFNCYRHWDTLVVQDMDGSGQLFYIKEGMSQGDPFVVIYYSIGILPLIYEFRAVHPNITQPWYADNT